MSRSLKVAPQYIQQAKSALRRCGFARQIDLAEKLQLSKATVWNFLNGRPVDYLNFYEISKKLGLDLQEIADFDAQENDSSSSALEVEPDEVSADVAQEQAEAEVSNYVDRPPIESRCYETILQPGSLLRIKAAKRMGKTLLIDRILDRAAKHNYRTVRLNLLQADQAVLKGLDEFLRCFCMFVSRRLGLPNQLTDYWEDGLGSSQNCSIYFEEHLLSQLEHPLVLALDDVDRIFPYPQIAEDFLGMLRVWHEEARTSRIWKKLRLVIAHSTEVYIQLNINRSPFNVGVPIELPEFTLEQVQDLAKRRRLDWDAVGAQGLAPQLEMVGGHPHLMQLANYSLTHQEITFEQLLQTAHTESGIYSDQLRGHLWNLQQYPELARAMKKVVDDTTPVQLEPMLAFKLQSLGLVRLNGNDGKPWCDLYAQYFRDRLS
ncbi:MAG: AAA-like domain-containing protein [Coleofasciculus sp. Co-bin14]|nr:AAA-like domain-containing protein [Coleofasciculus sp. Co-bin14]